VLEASISELRANLKTKEEDLVKSRAEYDALVSDSKNVVSLRASVDSAKNEIESAMEKVSAQIKAKEEVEATLQRARGEIAALSASVESGRTALADANTDANSELTLRILLPADVTANDDKITALPSAKALA
jgi:chromosome segregation ATPase